MSDEPNDFTDVTSAYHRDEPDQRPLPDHLDADAVAELRVTASAKRDAVIVAGERFLPVHTLRDVEQGKLTHEGINVTDRSRGKLVPLSAITVAAAPGGPPVELDDDDADDLPANVLRLRTNGARASYDAALEAVAGTMIVPTSPEAEGAAKVANALARTIHDLFAVANSDDSPAVVMADDVIGGLITNLALTLARHPRIMLLKPREELLGDVNMKLRKTLRSILECGVGTSPKEPA